MYAKSFHVQLLLLMLLLFDFSNQNAVEDVEALINGFSEMTDSGVDVLDRLGKISKGTLNLLKLAGPFGQLLHTGISVTLDEDSDELRAIKELNNKVTEKFEQLGHKMDAMLARMEHGFLMASYQSKITVNIGVFEHQISKFLDSRTKKSKDHLEEMCKDGSTSPVRLLLWLDGKVNLKTCSLPNSIENKVYAKAYALLGKMDEHLVKGKSKEFTETFEYKEWKTSMLYHLTELPYLDAIKHLVQIEKGLSNNGTFNLTLAFADLSQQLVYVLGAIMHKGLTQHRQKRDNDFNCIPKSIAMAYQRKRTPLLEISNMMITDVTKLDFIGVICAGIIAEGNVRDFAADMRLYERLTKKIAESMHSWITTELDSAWPDVIVSHGITALGNGTDDVKEADYERIAKLIQHKANERGSQSFLHQIVVGPAWERDRFFYEECLSEDCATIFGKRGVNVVISRYNNDEVGLSERLIRSLEWIEQNRRTVVDHFKVQLTVQGGNAKLTDIVQGISVRSNYTFFVGYDYWRQMVVLHNRKWFSQSCNIPMGFAGSKIMGMNAYDIGTDVFDTSSFTVANRYKMILMI